MNTKIVIVLINYNGYKDTIECLESIMKQDYLNFQVIVIDNSDSDYYLKQVNDWSNGEYKEKIGTNFPNIIYPVTKKPIPSIFINEKPFFDKELSEKLILVKAKQNNGFAAANNIALKYIQKFGAKTDLIWLLNNDTIISEGLMYKVMNEFDAYGGKKDKTIFGTPLLEYYVSNKIQAIGGKYNKFFGLTSHVGEGLDFDENLNTNQFKIDYPIGASMLVSNIFLEHVGLMNEDYFLFFEELDWCERVKKLNGRIEILNVFGVLHKQGESTNTKTNQNKLKAEFIDLLVIKNRILFSKKYFKKHTWSVILFIIIITVMKRFILGEFKRGVKIYKLLLREIF